MKHCIIVKFKEEIIKNEELYQDIENIFKPLEKIEGINKIEILKNCIARANRYDLVIRIDMEKEVLEIYDNSLPHHEWKEKYGNLIEKKAIFDYL